jgi:hypothetical protein
MCWIPLDSLFLVVSILNENSKYGSLSLHFCQNLDLFACVLPTRYFPHTVYALPTSSEGLWRWCIITITTSWTLSIVIIWIKNDVSETGIWHRPQVKKPTLLGPINRSSPCLPEKVFYLRTERNPIKIRTMDNIQEVCHCNTFIFFPFPIFVLYLLNLSS